MHSRPTTTKPQSSPTKYQQPVSTQSVYNPPKSRKLSILND